MFTEVEFVQIKTKERLSTDELEHINVYDPNAYNKKDLWVKFISSLTVIIFSRTKGFIKKYDFDTFCKKIMKIREKLFLPGYTSNK